MLPFARVDSWWHSGLAAAFPSAACFVIGGTFLFAAVRRIFDSTAAAVAAAALLALNPNLLYLQSTAMTEPVFFAALAALLYLPVRGWPAGAGIAACAATLTRYDGWFLIPFVAIYFLRAKRRGRALFSLIAGAAPLYWLGHNWWLTGDALDFFRGPYSAARHPGQPPTIPASRTGTWPLSISAPRRGFAPAPALPCWPLAGVVAAAVRRACWPLLLLALPAGLLHLEHPLVAAPRSSCPPVAALLLQHPLRPRRPPAPRLRRRCAGGIGAGRPGLPNWLRPRPPPSSSPPEPSIGRLTPGPRTGSPGRNPAPIPPAAAPGPAKPRNSSSPLPPRFRHHLF